MPEKIIIILTLLKLMLAGILGVLAGIQKISLFVTAIMAKADYFPRW